LETIDKYIEQKIIRNLDLLFKASELKELISWRKLVINGTEYRNISALMEYFSTDNLRKVFREDYCAVVHGDLTIENIVCVKGEEDSFYLIDPTPGAILESPFLDYGKLLQSLHGEYEFFVRLQEIEVKNRNVDFVFHHSANYKALYGAYQEYLEKHFTYTEQRSIYYHEAVHWVRMLGYKLKAGKWDIKKYYIAFIILLNDTIDRYGNANV
jgi:thiamine kinase-like enzyme